MTATVLDVATLETLLSAAVTAPSIHNTQPWRFRLDADTLTLRIHAASERGLRHIDPAGRALHLSVGCAVLNLKVAVTHFGRQPVTRLLPRPDRPDLLATLRIGGPARTNVFPGLYEALWHRHSSRFPFAEHELPPMLVTELVETAHSDGAFLHKVAPRDTERLLRLVREAEQRTTADPGRAAESRRWVAAGDGLGIPPEAVGPQDFLERLPMRDFGAHRDPASVTALPFEPHPSLMVLSTTHDRRADWLRAGEALEHVLLVATAHGVRTSLFHQALEWPDLRHRLASSTGGRPRHAQMVIRLGYGPEGPASPRREASM